ncbi:MAG: PIN domain-containing protein [Candidatus Hydrogenedens sp.]|nr:PIN domain-containing protein [Candidatus Hydrogenedens sp.]
MTTHFADSSFYLALLNPRDAWHEAAASFARDYRGTILTSDYILLELGALMSRGALRPVFANLVRSLKNDAKTEIVVASSDLLSDAISLFEERPDKDWSLADCASFVIMKDRRLELALTSDHHFEQAGYIRAVSRPN